MSNNEDMDWYKRNNVSIAQIIDALRDVQGEINKRKIKAVVEFVIRGNGEGGIELVFGAFRFNIITIYPTGHIRSKNQHIISDISAIARMIDAGTFDHMKEER